MPQLLSILHTIFIMGIVLGFMILIHEFGHFAVAKYFGVRVEVFSIGFGKRLLGFKKGASRVTSMGWNTRPPISASVWWKRRRTRSAPRWIRFCCSVTTMTRLRVSTARW